jgi:hypothetical protein
VSESTAGETLFERYLRDRGIDFDPDVPAGTKNVDFRLKTTPVVFCEVKDCGIGDAEKAEAEAFAKGHSVYISTPDFYGRLRDAIRKAARQLRRAKGSPCVVVLHNNGSSVLFYESFIWGAMFGGQVTRVPLDGEPVTTFTGNRVLGEKTNTTVSAVAVLSPTFANPELIERAAASARQSGDTRDIARAFVALSDEAPEAFAQTPCLRVHHNPFANTRLPRSVFNGARDLNLWPDFLPGPFAQPEDRG